jgi:acyl-homoserine-lactone acylase
MADLSSQVEITRTDHGVPHIRGKNLRAAGYGLGWVMTEDYGTRTPHGLLRARGEMGKVFGKDSMDGDFINRIRYQRALSTYYRLEKPTRDVYEGFADGVNAYIEQHRNEFVPGFPANFTGFDVAARDFGGGDARPQRFLSKVDPNFRRDTTQDPNGEGDDDNDNWGSNAWTFAPSKTKSGKAILLRNPHLNWNAGYYEAQFTVPGVIDFYGDFRIGGPFSQVGGFNRYLGWATTNNAPTLGVIYGLDTDPNAPDHYMFDGKSVAANRVMQSAEYKTDNGFGTESREFWFTEIGPVIYHDKSHIYVLKEAGYGQYRAGEQMLHMMRAKSLKEWKDAMRIRARVTSNHTYADRAGNILFLWNASVPLLPHPPGDDSSAVPAHGMKDVWTKFVPFESLPQFLNPKGGYTHNENNSPHFTNAAQGFDTTNAYPNFEKPRMNLRPQLGLQLASMPGKVSLEDVIARKHNYRMLLPDRVKSDLIAAVKATNPTGDVASALALIEKWDNTASPESRGSVLFDVWYQRYSLRAGARNPNQRRPDSTVFAKVWTSAEPTTTPRGLADPARAAEAFAWAVGETKRLYGSWDVPWGDVHRVRIGKVDVPVGGCGNDLGCFRILNFTRAPDGKLVANGGDGWILAVEFGDYPRAYSLLAYGESSKEDSPWHDDQAAMFAKGELKKLGSPLQNSPRATRH